MFYFMIFVFILGYTAIAMEHPLKVNKSATALLLAVLLWVMLAFGFPDRFLEQKLLEDLGKISEILFFLLGHPLQQSCH